MSANTSPAAVTGGLRRLSDLAPAQRTARAVDTARAAITQRLRALAQLNAFCARLTRIRRELVP